MGQKSFESNIRLMDYVEAWFDNHPEPENIDMHQFEFEDLQIQIFFADMVYNTWMIKITCNNARRAAHYSQQFHETTRSMGITQILIGNKLFLFQDQRF